VTPAKELLVFPLQTSLLQYAVEGVLSSLEESFIMEHGAEPVISCMSNQTRDECVLRVDRYFRTSGPCEERRIYGVGRTSVERVNSMLELVGLECLKLRVWRGGY